MSDIHFSNKRQYLLRLSCVSIVVIPLFFSLWFCFHLFKQSKCNRNYLIIDSLYENQKIIDDLIKYEVSDSPIAVFLSISLLKSFYDICIGEYEIKKNSSLFKIIKSIALRKKFIRRICLYEGCSMYTFIKILKRNKFLLGEIENIPMEGYLMPDTYTFTYPTTRQEIINRAKNAMDEFLKGILIKKNSNCHLKTTHEILTLASIVSKEAYDPEEMSKIAGVYLNRLKIKMRLQADPTTIYAMKYGDSLKRSVLFKDLRIHNPYNTYKNIGLPPTPIANPGKASILAVLNPKKSDYLFFVCGKNGKHIFAETFEEHKKNAKFIRSKNLANNI